MNTRQKILEILKTEDGYVSGEMLSKELGVSRNAVFKAIDVLRSEGHEIEGINRKGYMLKKQADILDADIISSYINGDLDVEVFDTIDSTNDEARRLYRDGRRKPVLIVADTQTKGRGRRGRDFYSPSHTGIYMTLLLFPDIAMEDSLKITTRTAVVIAGIIETFLGDSVGIKWVNDLYYHDRKFCGILTEAVTDFETRHVDAIILGIGINVTTEVFPEDIVAGSLGLHTVTRNEIAGSVADGIIRMVNCPEDSSYMEEYRKMSILTGKVIGFEKNGVTREGLVKGITDEGHLITEMNGEEVILSSGEISVRKDFLNR